MTRLQASCLTLLALAAASLQAQQGLFNHKDDKPKFSTPLPYRIFHLANVTEHFGANEIAVSVRHVIDSESVSLIGVQNDLLVIGSPEQLAAAADIIKILDQPRPLYHLSFTVTETDGGKKTVRHYALYTADGLETHLNSTRWIPLTPPPVPPADQSAAPKQEHIETGMTFEVTLDEYTGGARLKSKITAKSLAPEPPTAGTVDPIVEENSISNTSILHWGKPIVLGIIDPPNTTRHIEIEVTADQQLP